MAKLGEPLTEQELRVLRGMSDGKPNAEIGREMFISEDMVKTHARRLFRKLGARDRTHAVAKGFRAGLLSVEANRISLSNLLDVLSGVRSTGILMLSEVYDRLKLGAQGADADDVTSVSKLLIDNTPAGKRMWIRMVILQLRALHVVRMDGVGRLRIEPQTTFGGAVMAKCNSYKGAVQEEYIQLVFDYMVGVCGLLQELASVRSGLVAGD